MNQANLFYCLAWVIGSVFLFHCTAANGLNEQSSKNMQQSYNTHSLNVKASPVEIATEQKRLQERAREILSRKNKIFRKNDSDIQQDDTTQSDVFQTNAEMEQCKDTNSRCSGLKSTIESHFEAIANNVQLLDKINKNLDQLLVTLVDWKELCDKSNEINDDEESTTTDASTTLKPSQSKRSKHMTLTTISSSTTTIADEHDYDSVEQISLEESTTAESTTSKKNPSDNPISKPIPFDRNAIYLTFVGRENETAKIQCNQGKGLKISIINAYYGASDISKCPRTQFGPVTRQTADRTDIVRSFCGTWVKSHCSFSITTSSLGDTCPGVDKNLRVSYYCSLPGIISLRGN